VEEPRFFWPSKITGIRTVLSRCARAAEPVMDGNVENPYPAERMIALIANKTPLPQPESCPPLGAGPEHVRIWFDAAAAAAMPVHDRSLDSDSAASQAEAQLAKVDKMQPPCLRPGRRGVPGRRTRRLPSAGNAQAPARHDPLPAPRRPLPSARCRPPMPACRKPWPASSARSPARASTSVRSKR